VGDLAEDTAVERAGDGCYRASVSTDWALWGPVGGYVAAIALRAAGTHSALPLPASLCCHFLSQARFDVVDLEVRRLRASRSVESLTVLMTQRGTPVLSALVWTIADDVKGPERRLLGPPEVPAPEQVNEIVLDPDLASRTATTTTATGTFWKNIEVRKAPVEQNQSGGLQLHSWARFRPRAYFDDPWVDACRELISIDTAILPAVATALEGDRFVAPSIDLYAAFHAPPPAEDYLLVTAQGTAAGAGLVSGTAQTRSLDGTLTASGGSQFLCRMLNT
jgi:acyl-CoA thioesterase